MEIKLRSRPLTVTPFWVAAVLTLSLVFPSLGDNWSNFFPGCAPGGEPGPFMAQDRDGAVLVSGNIQRPDGSLDFVTLNYASNRLSEWTNIYRYPGSSYVGPAGIDVSPNGTIYVTGGSADTNDIISIVTIAYSTGGQPLWTNSVYNSGFANNYASAAAASPDGSVYITGISSDVLPGGYQETGGITVGYSSNGLALWTNTYGAAYSETDISRAIAVGSDGIAYVILLSSSKGNSQYATIA